MVVSKSRVFLDLLQGNGVMWISHWSGTRQLSSDDGTATTADLDWWLYHSKGPCIIFVLLGVLRLWSYPRSMKYYSSQIALWENKVGNVSWLESKCECYSEKITLPHIVYSPRKSLSSRQVQHLRCTASGHTQTYREIAKVAISRWTSDECIPGALDHSIVLLPSFLDLKWIPASFRSVHGVGSANTAGSMKLQLVLKRSSRHRSNLEDAT